MFSRVLRHLMPGSCLLCGQALAPDMELDLCKDCMAALPWNPPACPRCAHPVRDAASAWDNFPTPHPAAAPVCSECRTQPPPFKHALAPLRYESYPRAWVQRLKEGLGMVEGRVLGMLLASAAAGAYRAAATETTGNDPPPYPDLLVPVPLTPGRLAWRGHNQALTLALPVARRLGVPVLRRAVTRLASGHRQRGLSRVERLENLTGIFCCRYRWPEPGPCVAIVDDVLTTGATAAELSRALLAAGAAEVHVLSALRTSRMPAEGN